MSDFENVNKNNAEITKDDFRLVQENVKITDKKFQTKPTTFFKDAMRRFIKNKSSVVASFILGILILLSLFVPIFSNKDIVTVSKQEQFLAPKLFKAGTGFWDGTRKFSGVVYDTVKEAPAGYRKEAVLKISTYSEKINVANEYGIGGYVMFVNETRKTDNLSILRSPSFAANANDNYTAQIKLGSEADVENYELGEYRIVYEGTNLDTNEAIKLVLQDWSKNFTSDIDLNISQALSENGITNAKGTLAFELKGVNDKYTYLLVESVKFASNLASEEVKEDLDTISFTDATKMVLLAKDSMGNTPRGYWSCTGRKGIYQATLYFCNFVYDTYEDVYGYRSDEIYVTEKEQTDNLLKFPMSDLENFKKFGWCTYDENARDLESIQESFKVLNDKCPIDKIVSVSINAITGKVLDVIATGYNYKYLSCKYHNNSYNSMPKFLFGTDDSGQDLFKKAFKGLRISLILGVCTAAFCFIFGLCWGSISGYFGGAVDIIMERFCEILSGVPWIVIMTLCILHFGSTFGTFALALCLTGWMGTAGRTRTQFYRFKRREYILASRTLGANDMRLIFRHILPNSLGTIITGAVLMIPSVIFSEATLAYLNLGLKNLSSFGVIMSDNQTYLQSYPNLVIFPAVIISLMMISFNLFGNGLRDAINPSLKGSD